MYDKYRIAKKWVEDVQNHANWAKETFERVILIPCVILIEACSVVRLRRTATFNVGVGGGAARSGRTAPPRPYRILRSLCSLRMTIIQTLSEAS